MTLTHHAHLRVTKAITRVHGWAVVQDATTEQVATHVREVAEELYGAELDAARRALAAGTPEAWA